MKMAFLMLAGTALCCASAQAQEGGSFQPNSFDNLANVFDHADLDGNSELSRKEYNMLRAHTIDGEFVGDYASDGDPRMIPTVERGYATLDRNNDGTVSLTEFMNVANDARHDANPSPSANATVEQWDWDPDYMTLTYYLAANKIDTDRIEGQQVVNLKGDEVGAIDRIIRDEDNGRYYAMIDIADDGYLYPVLRGERDEAGVPLDNLLLSASDHALLLNGHGEDYLRETDARVLDAWEPVDAIYVY